MGLLVLLLWPGRNDGTPSEEVSQIPAGQPIQSLEDPARPTEQPFASRESRSANGSHSAPPDHPENYRDVSFATLAGFEILAQPGRGLAQSPEPQWVLDQVPGEIHELNGQSIAIEGFMLPLRMDMESGLVREFALMKDHAMCCFGEIPDFHEFILVQMKPGHEVPAMMEDRVRVWGELSVREVGQGGVLYGIYHLSGTGVQRR